MKLLLNKIFLFMFIIVSLAFSKNPLNEYIEDDEYNEGYKTFKDSNIDIFQEAKGTNSDITSRFIEVVAVIKQGGKWSSTFYFKDGERVKRVTIRGSGVIRGENSNYAVTSYSKGIMVRDISSGEVVEIEVTKRREQ